MNDTELDRLIEDQSDEMLDELLEDIELDRLLEAAAPLPKQPTLTAPAIEPEAEQARTGGPARQFDPRTGRTSDTQRPPVLARCRLANESSRRNDRRCQSPDRSRHASFVSDQLIDQRSSAMQATATAPEIAQAVEIEPAPPALQPHPPHYEAQFPSPPLVSDAGLDGYLKFRSSVALAEHAAQLGRVMRLITEQMKRTLNPATTFEALLLWEHHFKIYGMYAERTGRIAKKLKVKHAIPTAPEPPAQALVLARTDGLGTASRDQLTLATADAARRLERAAQEESDAMAAFSRPDWLDAHRIERVDVPPYLGSVNFVERWPVDAVFVRFENKRLARQKADDRLRVLRRDGAQAGDFLVSAAQSAIDAAGGVEVIASAMPKTACGSDPSGWNSGVGGRGKS